MTTFALNEALGSGPPRQVMTSDDPRFVVIAAYRRCRMKNYDEALSAGWTGVDAVTEDGEHVPLLEFRRVEHGVKVERGLPAWLLYFEITETETGELMIERVKP